MKGLQSFVLTGALLLSTTVNSAILTYTYGAGDTYTHNDSTDIVEDTARGLEWLQWDRTINQSMNDISALLDTIEGGGWSFANRFQISSLYSDFFGATFSASELEHAGFENLYKEITPPNSEGADPLTESDVMFISMFGDTSQSSCGTSPDCYRHSAAVFGVDAYSGNFYKSMQVVDDYKVGSATRLYGGWSGLSAPHYDYFEAHWSKGVALVRNSAVTPPPGTGAAPEPGILALMSMGLFGLVVFRRRS